MLRITNGLQFTPMSITSPLINIKRLIRNQMPHLVHVSHWPIWQLTVIDHFSTVSWSQSEDKGTARKLLTLDALQFTLSNGSHRQTVPHDRLVEPRSFDYFDETFWGWESRRCYNSVPRSSKVIIIMIIKTHDHYSGDHLWAAGDTLASRRTSSKCRNYDPVQRPRNSPTSCKGDRTAGSFAPLDHPSIGTSTSDTWSCPWTSTCAHIRSQLGQRGWSGLLLCADGSPHWISRNNL